MLLSGDGHTSVRGRREAPRDEADLCWQLLLQLLCIFQFQVQRRAAMTGLGHTSVRDRRREAPRDEQSIDFQLAKRCLYISLIC